MNFLIRAAAIAAMLHITPIVVLVKRSDAVQALLPGADVYVAREVHLSGTDAHRLHETVDWSPEDGVLVFYGGTAGSTSVGALEFVRVDTPHGPIEVAVGFTPQGAVRGGGRDRGPGRESRRRRGRRGGQRRRPGSCGVRSLLQSCEGLTGGASVTFSATAGGGKTSIWA